MVYIQVSRGVAPRSHIIPDDITPTLVMTFRPLVPLPEAIRLRGAKIMTMADTRWANCFIKAVTLLPNVLARHAARKKGFDDALFVAADGEVREGTSSNVFLARNGRLLFPPRTHSVLHGCTQGFLLECAAAIELPVVEERITRDALHAADEVFISSTTIEVLGVTQIDEHRVGDGRVGPITQRLHNTFRQGVRTACGAIV
jgi:D-alanine transaminase